MNEEAELSEEERRARFAALKAVLGVELETKESGVEFAEDELLNERMN